MTASTQIREAKADDMMAVAEIYAHHVLTGVATFEVDPPSVQEMTDRWQSISSTGLPYLVARQQTKIVGFAYAAPYRTRHAYRCTVEDSIYLDPNHFRQGIGRKLLAPIIEKCEQQGYRQMIAVVGGTRNTGSIGLHTSLGFRELGTLQSVGFKLDQWVDTVFLQRGLGAGNTSPPD